MPAADDAALDAATVARLLTRYLGELKRASRKYQHLDQHELRAVWEDAVCEAYRSHDPLRASEATWVCRVFQWRLHALLDAASHTRQISLGTDPKILNGINPEKAFWERAAMDEVLKLPPRQQTILIAHLNGYTYAEVAVQVGISRSRAHQECEAALKTIRERFGLGNTDRS